MARCWRCGQQTTGFRFKCSACEAVSKTSDLQKELQSFNKQVAQRDTELANTMQQEFKGLSDKLSDVATILVWGFEELNWELQKQTKVLRSIDHTLKTPTQTQANEWRLLSTVQ